MFLQDNTSEFRMSAHRCYCDRNAEACAATMGSDVGAGQLGQSDGHLLPTLPSGEATNEDTDESILLQLLEVHPGEQTSPSADSIADHQPPNQRLNRQL